MNGNNSIKMDFTDGFRKAIPIMLGYIPVSFTFGIMASGEGLDAFTAVLISLTNFTSAGQFAGTQIIASNGTLLEIALTTFIINIRYSLMSLSLSQRIAKMSLVKKMIMSFGITDETFTVASFEERVLNFPFLLGLNFFPYLSWAIGTFLGATTSSILSPRLQASMGISLYGMFLALIVPSAKRDKEVLAVVFVALLISSLFRYVPVLTEVSNGWVVIISTIVASTFGAIKFREDK